MKTKQKFTYPITQYKDNLFIAANRDVWAYYFIRSTNIQMQDSEMIESRKRDFQYTWEEIGKRYKGFDISLYPYEVNLKNQYKELSSDFSKENYDIANHYAEKTVSILEQMYGKLTKPRYVIGIKLKEYNEVVNRFEQLKGGMEEAKDNIMDILLGSTKETDHLFQEMKQEEADLFSELGALQPIRLTTAESAYLQKFNFLRNSPHLKEEEQREQTLNEITEAILYPRVKSGFLGIERGVIAIETEYGTQYVSLLPISDLPDYLVYTHLFYRTQNMPFPCEFHVKGRTLNNEGLFTGVKGKVTGKRKLLKTNVKEVIQSGDPASKRLAINMKKTEMIQEDIEEELRISEWLGCFVVYGSTVKECRSHSRYLRKWFGKQKIKVEAPLADQEKLFYTLLQGESKGSKYWHQFNNSYGMAEFLFGVTNELGNNIGFPIGVQTEGYRSIEREEAVKQSRKIVYWNPLAVNQNIKSSASAVPHIEVTGKSGNGKSFLMKLFFYILQLLEIDSLYFDPKVELEKIANTLLSDKTFIKKNPYFAKMLFAIKYITLDSQNTNNHGVLDPLVFLPPTEAKTVAEGIIYQIYDLNKNDRIKVEVLETLNYLIAERERGELVGMRTLIELLRNHREKEIQQVGKIMQNEVENSVLELVFSDGTTEGLSLEYKHLVLSVAGLSLPKPEKRTSEYDAKERKSIAVMLCVGKFIRLFGSQNDKQYTCEIFDESWVLESSDIGRDIIQEIKKVGRSMCNLCIFGTQSVKDNDSDKTMGQVGTMFVFDEDSEREEILQRIGLSVTPNNIELLRNLRQGQCLMRDNYDRINKLTVHSLFSEWTYASKTVDRTASGNLEEKYA